MKKFSRYWMILVLALIAAMYASLPLLLPASQPETVPTREFSAERAFKHVVVISKEPHPAESAAMKDVAAYLLQTLQTDGLQAEIQETSGHSQWMNKTLALNNVVARIPGTDSSGAVLIMSHPDSTRFGPGAGDNATGAATLLEVARALKAGEPLKNDIIILFDDGEEPGYLGGYAFVREHPWMADVRLVIGVDTAAWGPVNLLQAIPPSRALIKGYAESTRQPVAYALYADYDWTLGHDTALTYPFVERGIPALDFEDGTAATVKHSAADTIEKIEPGSMQQMGDQVLAAARQYGDMDLDQLTSPSESFFTLWGIGLLHYPAALNYALAVFFLLGFGALAVLGARRNMFDGKGLVRGALLAAGAVFITGLLGFAAGEVFARIFPKPQPYIDKYLVPASLPYFIAILVLVVVVFTAIRSWSARRVGAENLAFAGVAPWAIFILIFVMLAPVGSYAFVLPPLFGIIGWGLVILKQWERNSAARMIVLTLPMLAGILLLVPVLALMFISTGIDIWLTAMVTVMLLDLGIVAANG